MVNTITYTGQLVVVTCWCGITHAIPADLDRWASQSNKNTVYCPLGHEWVIKESIETKLKREREHAAFLRSQLDQESARADHEAARRKGYQGALTKAKKRIGKGVCPCCNRHFANVERHMATRHPDYADGET